jgi:hypothetical protein
MCLNETYSKVHIRKHLPDNFPIQNGQKQGDALLPQLFNLLHNSSLQPGICVTPGVGEDIFGGMQKTSYINQNKIQL